jgi:hypothetical protein
MQIELFMVMRDEETLQCVALGQDLRISMVLAQENFLFQE